MRKIKNRLFIIFLHIIIFNIIKSSKSRHITTRSLIKRYESVLWNDEIITEYDPKNDESIEEKEEEEEEINIYSFEQIPIKYWTNDEKEDLQEQTNDNIYISSVESSTNFNFYDQLNYKEKQYYDIIYKNSIKSPPETTIKISITTNISKDDFISELKISSERVFTILIYENPEFWWIGNYSIKLSTLENKYLVTFIIIPSNSKFINYTSNDIVQLNEEIESIKKIIMNNIDELNLTTKYAIMRYVHDYLITKIVYTLDEKRKHIRTLYGSLVENKCVCEGYAEAFQYIVKQYNINCIIARSSTHEWNFVEMDGKWYVLDVTYDDLKGDKIPTNSYDNLTTVYFLIGTEHVCYSKKKYNEDTDHILVYSGYSSNQLISYPYIEINDYVPSELELEEIKLIDLDNIANIKTATISKTITTASVTTELPTTTKEQTTSTELITSTSKFTGKEEDNNIPQKSEINDSQYNVSNDNTTSKNDNIASNNGIISNIDTSLT
ncbi:hypothetical protein BCR32DRAFT_272550 [Anaeromyces robustus]|uniref:Transglutaminase-like domain-containing protein n=1 Tax=Anaeromyces robustus TaxID=1754192 RepID=A0A1Y1W2V9_9FUNG|nr:hypothetical protein BCR32DRAFT_272550 [Anaeromyces robustus]|eukprot:ORX67712.1 hypothetical protein BCR32DRAFT_272550 [Anaeromyces robustus]